MILEQTAPAFRLLFEKTGPIRFISHLDLTRAFHRAFARAQIPLKFSEGFSPHPKFSFALPLSVGTESLTEYADFSLKPGTNLDPETLKEKLQEQMPAGIKILSVGEQKEKFSQIAFAQYRIFLPKAPADQIPDYTAVLCGPVVIQKKNKKGKWVEKDIASGIHSITFEEKNGGTEIFTILSASGENYLKPELVLSAIGERCPAFLSEEKEIVRTRVLKEDLTLFS